jgi:hypothetical protein
MGFPALLTVDEFIARTVMPAPDVRRARGVWWKKNNADATASTALGELVFGKRVGGDATVLELDFVPAGTLVADAVNFATLTVSKRTPGNPTPTVLGSVSTNVLSWADRVPVPLGISSAAVLNGDVITVAITKSGTGVVVPPGELFVVWSPSFLETTILDWSSEFYARLLKRYEPPTAAKPWPNPVTSILKRWLTKLVTRDTYAQRGFSPTSEQDRDAIEKAAEDVEKKLVEAADGQNGLIELELGEDGTESATRDTPMSYAEQSPYTAHRLQRRAGRLEDRSITDDEAD